MHNVVNLTNKRIIVTGASSGIGMETAILCSKLGAKLILISRNNNKLEHVISLLEGNGHTYYPFDLNNLDDIEALIKKIVSDVGEIDGFVHSAGIGSTRPIKSLKPQFLSEVMSINYFSFIELIRCITKKNHFSEGLSIVGVSSISSQQGNKAKTAYCASKAAMDASVRCLAKELSEKKIRVNTVNPALIKTDIYQQFLNNSGDSDDAKAILARQYLGLGEPLDVANMIAFLLSNAAKFITGSSVNIDGGRLSS